MNAKTALLELLSKVAVTPSKASPPLTRIVLPKLIPVPDTVPICTLPWSPSTPSLVKWIILLMPVAKVILWLKIFCILPWLITASVPKVISVPLIVPTTAVA